MSISPQSLHPLKQRILDRRRVFSLDVLRGTAAVLVLFRHLPPTDYRSDDFAEQILSVLHRIGWVGVDLFFVLSGVLISTLIYRELEERGGFDSIRFLLRRGFKIWPAYFAAYGTATVLRIAAEFVRGRRDSAAQITLSGFWNSVFLQNYVDCERWPHSWSIAVEEHFYTGLALLTVWFVATRRRSRPSPESALPLVTILWAVTAMIGLALRYRISVPAPDWEAVYYPTHLRLDALLFGVLIGGRIWTGRQNSGYSAGSSLFALFGTCAALAVPMICPLRSSSFLHVIGFPLIYLGFGTTVAWASAHPDGGLKLPGLLRRILQMTAWIGTYSYTIYIAHAVVFMIPGAESFRQACLSRAALVLPPAACVWMDRFGFWTASVFGGVLLAKIIERPALRLREKVLPSGRRVAAPAPAS